MLRPFISKRSLSTSSVLLSLADELTSWGLDDTDQPVPPLGKEPRLPKKKVALMVGFNGSQYQGMQTNPGAYTVEGVLFDALCKAGAVSSSNSVDPKKVQLMRAARTDKGVHASCNLLSLKMICEDVDLVNTLNSLLPADIRVWGYVKTQSSFHAKNKCDSRKYEYLFPSYVLEKLGDSVLKKEKECEEDVRVSTEKGGNEYYVTPTPSHLLMKYRVSQDRLDHFRHLMSLFKGTHNFHNYTIAKSAKDKSSSRHLIDIKVEDPFVMQGMEWISVKLHGQSFMLHQIRKMMTMGIMSVRTNTSSELLVKSFESPKINIPKAPSLGLLLDRPVFDYYNEKIREEGVYDLIDYDLYKEEIDTFKRENIYQQLFEAEVNQKIFDSYFILLDTHLDGEFAYFNKEGIIPDHCLLTTKYTSS